MKKRHIWRINTRFILSSRLDQKKKKVKISFRISFYILMTRFPPDFQLLLLHSSKIKVPPADLNYRILWGKKKKKSKRK